MHGYKLDKIKANLVLSDCYIFLLRFKLNKSYLLFKHGSNSVVQKKARIYC